VKEVISGELRGAKADESFADERHNGVLDWNHAVDNASVNADCHPRFTHAAGHCRNNAEVECPYKSDTDSQGEVVTQNWNSVDDAVDLQRAGERVKHWHNRSEKDG
jgi:hypothetical protein